MRKSFTVLWSIGVCALIQVGVAAQSAQTVTEPISSETISADQPVTPSLQPLDERLRTKMDEAKQLLKSHADLSGGKTVTVAALDPQGSQLHLLTIEKDSF